MENNTMAIKKLEERLKCSICLQIYEDPKLLNCSHAFCAKCLQELVSKTCRRVLDGSRPFSLACPTCREVTSIFKDVAELKCSFQTNQFLDVLKDLKANKISSQSALKSLFLQTAESSEIETFDSASDLRCSAHSSGVCNLFCKTCNTLICSSCTIMEHRSHDFNAADVEFENTKIELSSSLSQLDRVIKKLQDGVSDIALQKKRIINQKSALEAEIRGKIESLHKVLDDRLSELLGDLNLLMELKLSSLKAEKDQVDSNLCPLIQFRDSMRASIDSSTQHKLLKEKKLISKTLQQKLVSYQSLETVSVQTKADMKFSSSPYVSDTCRNYGNVYAPGRPHPSICRAEGEGLEKAVVGVPATIDVSVLDYHGEICKEMFADSLESRLESVLSGSSINGSVKSLGSGQYRVTYLPTFRGEHLLHIRIDRENIKESPFPVEVDCSVEKLGSVVQTISGLDKPCGLGFTPTGNIVVAEDGGKTISILLSSGKKFKSFGGLPGGGEKAHCGVTMDGQSGIILVDTHEHCVRLFSLNGELVVSVGSMGTGQLKFMFPQDIAYNPTTDQFYVVDLNNRVQVLNSDLSFHRMFGKYGSGNGQFNTPHGIACDKNGNIYIADTNNHRVVITNSQGKFLRKITTAKETKFVPISVAVDGDDQVYVGEADSSISVFSSKGDCLVSFGDDSSSRSHPFAISLNKNGMLYVCDMDNNCILVF